MQILKINYTFLFVLFEQKCIYGNNNNSNIETQTFICTLTQNNILLHCINATEKCCCTSYILAINVDQRKDHR